MSTIEQPLPIDQLPLLAGVITTTYTGDSKCSRVYHDCTVNDPEWTANGEATTSSSNSQTTTWYKHRCSKCGALSKSMIRYPAY